MLAAFCLVLTSSESVAQPTIDSGWKKDWNVRCTWLDRVALEQFARWFSELVAKVPEEVARELGEEFADYQCDDSLPGSVVRNSRREFRGSSAWLQGLGFPRPIMNRAPDRRKYLAWMDVFSFRNPEIFGRGLEHSNGHYRDSGDIFLMPGAVAGTSVEAHELFHGVQHRAAQGTFRRHAPHHQWIWEGTARAEDFVWAIKSQKMFRLENRYWDVRLTDSTVPYGASLFWLDVGRQLRSQDAIAYLVDLLARLRTGGDVLPLVDEALADALRERGADAVGGLATVFPEFVRRQLNSPDRLDQFRSRLTAQLSLPGRTSDVEETSRISGAIEPLAAQAIEVRVQVPASRVASLRIELVDDSEALHLVVDDRRYNREPELEDTNGRRNRFSTVLSGSDRPFRFWVRVVNAGVPADLVTRPFDLDLTLTSSHGGGSAAGTELVRFQQGAHFSYVNMRRDPKEMARSAQGAVVERSAQHAGVDRQTPQGFNARQIIDGAVASVLGPPPEPPAPGAGFSSITPGAECAATITLFDDSERTVAKLFWRGEEPLIGGEHEVKAVFATGLHDTVYNEYKRLGQELTLLEDPEALAAWVDGFGNLTLPSFSELLRRAGGGVVSRAKKEVVDGIFDRLPFGRAREKVAERRSGGNELGRIYEGSGTLRVEAGPSDRIEASYRFGAERNDAVGRVQVDGEFVVVPGPLSNDNLWNGCERFWLAEEDNGDIAIPPARYPPPIPDLIEEEEEEEEEEKKKRKWPWPIPIPITWDCIPDWSNATTTVQQDWTWQRTESDGTRVFERRVEKTPSIWLDAGPFGSRSTCRPKIVVEERRFRPDQEPKPCVPNADVGTWRTEPASEWSIVQDGEQWFWERQVKVTPTVASPAVAGGDTSRCRSFERTDRLPIPPEEERSGDEDDDPQDCRPGPRAEWRQSVLVDWHAVTIGGVEREQRVLQLEPTIERPPRRGGSWQPCRLRSVLESRPIGGSEGGSPVDDPEDPEFGGGLPPEMPGDVGPGPGGGGDDDRNLLTLDFIEGPQLDLEAVPQRVSGSASADSVMVSGAGQPIVLRLEEQELSACGNEATRRAFRDLSRGPMVGQLSLQASAGAVTLRIETASQTVELTGPAHLSSAAGVTTGRVRGATASLESAGEVHQCIAIVDFDFVVAEI